MNTYYTSRQIEELWWVWLQHSNQYLRLEEPAFFVFEQIVQDKSVESIAGMVRERYGLDSSTSKTFVSDIFEALNQNLLSTKEKSQEVEPQMQDCVTDPVYSYRFVGKEFSIRSNSEVFMKMIAPMLEYLRAEVLDSRSTLYSIEEQKEQFVLFRNDSFLKAFAKNELHVLTGSFYFELVKHCYEIEENQWLATLHGAVISNGESAIALTGFSGKGKSTASTLLMASGYDLLSDDIIPVCKNQKAYRFPTAISVKRGAVEVVKRYLPHVEDLPEYSIANGWKQVRYLPPFESNCDKKNSFPVRTLLSIEYNPEVEEQLVSLPKAQLLPELIEEAWISPERENSEIMLDWFDTLKVYKLVYHRIKFLQEQVAQLFNEDL